MLPSGVIVPSLIKSEREKELDLVELPILRGKFIYATLIRIVVKTTIHLKNKYAESQHP